MKRIKGIKALSITAIITNALIALIVFFNLINMGGFGQKSIRYMFMMILVLALLAVIYPVQLLLIRGKYYDHVPVSHRAKVLLHIFRSIQLLFIICLTLMLASITSFIIMDFKTTSGHVNTFIGQLATSLFILLAALLNFSIFFKGWKLLKLINKSNYIDEVMSAFD